MIEKPEKEDFDDEDDDEPASTARTSMSIASAGRELAAAARAKAGGNPALRRLELLAEQKRIAELTSRLRGLRPRRHGAVPGAEEEQEAPLTAHGRQWKSRERDGQFAEQERAIHQVAGDHVRHAPRAAASPRTSSSRDPTSTPCCRSPSARHTSTLTCPDSSSSVTKVTPLAVCGRWRVMTRPATRTKSPVRCLLQLRGRPAPPAGARAAAPADAGPA